MDSINKDIVVLYHGACTDGFSGAWAAWKKFGDEAAYVPAYWGRPIPNGLVNKEIYLVDFTYSKEIISDLIKNNKRVTAIDHHQTAEVAAKMTHDYLFDNNHSGAVLAWKYFHPEKPVPKLLQYVQEMDLWRYNTPESRPVMMAVTALETYDFSTWSGIAQDLENDEFRHDYIKKGDILLRFQDKQAQGLIEQGQMVDFAGYKIKAVNAPHTTASHIGALLAKEFPFALIWSQEKEIIFVSLRSDHSSPEPFDVSVVARKFGGGGHKTSAGFNFPAGQEFPWKIIHEDDGK